MRVVSLLLLGFGLYFVGSAIRLAVISAHPHGAVVTPWLLRADGDRIVRDSRLSEEEKKKVSVVLDTALDQGAIGFRLLDRAVIELGLSGVCCVLGAMATLFAARKSRSSPHSQLRGADAPRSG